MDTVFCKMCGGETVWKGVGRIKLYCDSCLKRREREYFQVYYEKHRKEISKRRKRQYRLKRSRKPDLSQGFAINPPSQHPIFPAGTVITAFPDLRKLKK